MRVGESPRREWGNPRRTHRSRSRKGLYGRPNQQVLKQTAWRIREEWGGGAAADIKPTTLEFRITKLGLRRPGKWEE